MGAKPADCCALPVILGQESDLVSSPRWDGSAEGTNSPPCMWLAVVCHASSGEELGAKHTHEHVDYSLSWVQACFSDSHSLEKGWGFLALETEVFCLQTK